MEGRLDFAEGDLERLGQQAARWRSIGATHLSVNTMGAGLQSLDGHLGALEAVGDVLAAI
jgi:hypothetical protein